MEIVLYLRLEKMKSISKGTRICARLVEKLLNFVPRKQDNSNIGRDPDYLLDT